VCLKIFPNQYKKLAWNLLLSQSAYEKIVIYPVLIRRKRTNTAEADKSTGSGQGKKKIVDIENVSL